MILPKNKLKIKKKIKVPKVASVSLKSKPILFSKIVIIHSPKTGGTSIKDSLKHYMRDFPYDMYHATAQQMLTRGLDTNKTFTFAFIRNPYDRFVSFYYYFLQRVDAGFLNTKIYNQIKDKSFVEFCYYFKRKKLPIDFFKPQYHYIAGIKPNFIGRYEHLRRDWKKLLVTINKHTTFDIPLDKPLSWFRKSKHKDYRTYYTASSRKIVFEYYKKDFEIFKYSPDLYFSPKIDSKL